MAFSESVQVFRLVVSSNCRRYSWTGSFPLKRRASISFRRGFSPRGTASLLMWLTAHSRAQGGWFRVEATRQPGVFPVFREFTVDAFYRTLEALYFYVNRVHVRIFGCHHERE